MLSIFFVLYWGFFLIGILLSLFVIFKRNILVGLMQLACFVITPVWAFLFCLKRDYIYPGLEKNELIYMFNQIKNLNMEAILILFMYIIVIILFLFNLKIVKKKISK